MKPDLHVIALEETEHWELEPEDWRSVVERIETVYLFDRNQRTHCCEVTPSYYLVPVETRAIFRDPDLDDRTIDRFDNQIKSCPPEPCYVHCHQIEALVEQLRKEQFRYKHIGDPDLPDEEGDFLEAMAQCCRENAVI